MSFRDEKQLKANRERVARGLAPVTKAYKQAKNTESSLNPIFTPTSLDLNTIT